MNKKLAAILLLTSGLACAATPVDGWYTAAFVGFNFLPDNIRTVVNGQLLNSTQYHTGYNFGGRVGLQCNPLRYEGEFTYFTSTLDHFNLNDIRQIRIRGSSNGDLIMANIYYDFPEMLPAISPFLGVGLGYAVLETTLFSGGPFIPHRFSFRENEFAYQGMVGFTYNFAENYAVDIGYRYVATAGQGSYGRVFQDHIANAAVIYHFDRGFYK